MTTRKIEHTTIPPPRMIQADNGGFRVYRAYVQHGRWGVLRYGVPPGVAMCRRCGCTTAWGCAPPCSWADSSHTICSRCVEELAR